MEFIESLYANIDLHMAAVYVTAIVTMFATTFLRGFQNKNVAGGYIKLAGVFGYAMAVCDMVTIGLVVKGGLAVAFIGAIGAALGWMAGMVVHNLLMKKREKERARIKKERKRSRREEYLIHLIQEQLQDHESKIS